MFFNPEECPPTAATACASFDMCPQIPANVVVLWVKSPQVFHIELIHYVFLCLFKLSVYLEFALRP